MGLVFTEVVPLGWEIPACDCGLERLYSRDSERTHSLRGSARLLPGRKRSHTQLPLIFPTYICCIMVLVPVSLSVAVIVRHNSIDKFTWETATLKLERLRSVETCSCEVRIVCWTSVASVHPGTQNHCWFQRANRSETMMQPSRCTLVR